MNKYFPIFSGWRFPFHANHLGLVSELAGNKLKKEIVKEEVSYLLP